MRSRGGGGRSLQSPSTPRWCLSMVSAGHPGHLLVSKRFVASLAHLVSDRQHPAVGAASYHAGPGRLSVRQACRRTGECKLVQVDTYRAAAHSKIVSCPGRLSSHTPTDSGPARARLHHQARGLTTHSLLAPQTGLAAPSLDVYALSILRVHPHPPSRPPCNRQAFGYFPDESEAVQLADSDARLSWTTVWADYVPDAKHSLYGLSR